MPFRLHYIKFFLIWQIATSRTLDFELTVRTHR